MVLVYSFSFSLLFLPRSTSDIQSTTSTFVDNIPLISARTDESTGYQSHQDEDIIGEEVRPLPIDSSMDAQMRALHALLQDHTYVQLLKISIATTTPTTVTSNVSSTMSLSTTVTNTVDSNRSPIDKLLPKGTKTQGILSSKVTPNVHGKIRSSGMTYTKAQLDHANDVQKSSLEKTNHSASPQQHAAPNIAKYNQKTNQMIPSTASPKGPMIPGYNFPYNILRKGKFQPFLLDRPECMFTI